MFHFRYGLTMKSPFLLIWISVFYSSIVSCENTFFFPLFLWNEMIKAWAYLEDNQRSSCSLVNQIMQILSSNQLSSKHIGKDNLFPSNFVDPLGLFWLILYVAFLVLRLQLFDEHRLSFYSGNWQLVFGFFMSTKLALGIIHL